MGAPSFPDRCDGAELGDGVAFVKGDGDGSAAILPDEGIGGGNVANVQGQVVGKSERAAGPKERFDFGPRHAAANLAVGFVKSGAGLTGMLATANSKHHTENKG